MKERLTAIFLFFLALLTVWALVKKLPDAKDTYGTIIRSRSTEDADDASSSALRDEVIRLHILADSDLAQDQEIKLRIRDTLLPYLSAATLGATTQEEAKQQLLAQCDSLTEIANRTLQTLGADYLADISIVDCYFPIRIYGSQTYLSKDAVIFPPGYYTSVQVILGRGEGHNWWCLAYPSLCFIDATYEYVPKDSLAYKKAFSTLPQDSLEQLFYGTSSAPDDASSGSEINIYLGSKLIELYKALSNAISPTKKEKTMIYYQ